MQATKENGDNMMWLEIGESEKEKKLYMFGKFNIYHEER